MSVSVGIPTAPASSSPSAAIPRLHAGDRLTAAEFLRRYEAMPEVNNAELIEGVVYIMSSPVTHTDHGRPHLTFNTWMGLYLYKTPVVDGGDNSTLQFDVDNVPQPDGFLRVREEFGGQSRIVGRYIVGGPECIAEISASSVSYDLHDKLNAYRRNGVQEYVVWRVLDQAIDWFVLHEGRYDRLPLDAEGIYRSRVLPGLWLDPAAMIAGNFDRVLEVIQQGVASPAHQEFVARLQGQARESK